ncbi:MAG: hypothetical protein JO170_10145, partial [Verrucomicrobia bacterium]|nr:hypothetical protein [Verrucomicrobiota bacterium]
MNSIDRRRFLLSCAGLLGIGTLSPKLRGADYDEQELVVDFDVPGRLIPRDFLGLSFETQSLFSEGIFLPENRSLISLVQRLGPTGIIRIGGNSSDRPYLDKWLHRNRTHFKNLAGFLSATGWRLIYGLDLGSDKAEQAATEAEMVAELVGSKLLAFQFGNEPDLFRSDLRRSNYNCSDYLIEWREFLKALRTRVSGGPVAGPDISYDTSWLGPFITRFGSQVVFLTCHYYSEGPASSAEVTMERMLDSGDALRKLIDSVASYTEGSQLKVRMAEINSVFGGGKPGISDTLGAALWGVDVMFTLAQAGWLGINFHVGNDAYYSPVGRTGIGAFEPRPLYYAMLLFAYAGRGSIVPIRGQRKRLRAFAIRGKGNERKLVLVNKNLAQAEHVRITTTGHTATILHLTAPSAESKT